MEVGESSQQELRAFVQDECDAEVDDRWLRCHQEASGSTLLYMLRRSKAIRDISDSSNSNGLVREEITRDLKLHIPCGYVENCRQYPVVHCSAEITMKTTQIFDELPPLFQSMTKVLSIATRRGLFKVPTSVTRHVMDDLYGGLDDKQFETMTREMIEMYLLKSETSGGVETVGFRAPSLGHVALDVCTPHQIQTISSALVHQLGLVLTHNFKIPLMMALLSHDIGEGDEDVNHYWRAGYMMFRKESNDWSNGERNWWLERIADLVVSSGGDPSSILGKEFSTKHVEEALVPHQLKQLKSYVAPISFGPMGHTVSVISRSLFQDYGAHSRSDNETKENLRKAFASAHVRYLKEVKELEGFLAKENLAATESQQQSELELIDYLCSESTSAEDVCAKSDKFITDFMDGVVRPRLERLRLVVCMVGNGSESPSVFFESNNAPIEAAYSRLRECKCWKDSTELALMVLAVANWKPTRVPDCELLPAFYYQTIVRIRDSVLKEECARVTKESGLRHVSSFEDFEAFLIVTALLDKRPAATQKHKLRTSVSMELAMIEEAENERRESDASRAVHNARSHRMAMSFVSSSGIAPVHELSLSSIQVPGESEKENPTQERGISSDRLETIEKRLEVVERFMRTTGFQQGSVGSLHEAGSDSSTS